MLPFYINSVLTNMIIGNVLAPNWETIRKPFLMINKIVSIIQMPIKPISHTISIRNFKHL